MAYVQMTKDFSEVKKTIPGTGFTKRQLIAGITGLAVGIPTFILLYGILKIDATLSALGVVIAVLPFGFCILFKKHNLGFEKWAQFFYEAHFVRNHERPYMTDNLYAHIFAAAEVQKEVEKIVFAGKTQKEVNEIKKSGQSSVITIGRGRSRKRIKIPLQGPIDPRVKKELARSVAKAKVKGDIPESAQDSIPYKAPYPDGTFLSDDGYYTRTIAFEDITYQLLDNEPKNQLFERWCRLHNYFDPEMHIQFNYGNLEMNREKYRKEFEIPPQKDNFQKVRTEYSNMLLQQFSKGTNSLSKERYVTFGIHAADYRSACSKLNSISKQLQQFLKKLGCRCHQLTGYERLELLFRIFHPGTGEKLLWNFDMQTGTGLSSKDFIAPASFSFKYGPDLNATRYFRVGSRIGAASAVQVFASDMEDRILADVLNIDSNVWISIHADPVNRQKALDLAAENVTNLQNQIIKTQMKAVQDGYDMDLLPPEMKVFKDAGDKLYHDLQRKDEQLFNATITIVQTASTRKELEDNIFKLEGILSAYQCRLERLDYRQEQGYFSALPLGNNAIEISRTFTTTDMAIFIPFTTKELYSHTGQYYGMNSLSNNVILIDKKRLVNPNTLIFGMPGSGKTFFTKREIFDVFLKTRDDILIIDPEGEYKYMAWIIGGQVTDISLNSKVYINPMEINLAAQNEEDSEYDPIASKCNFVASMCELILGDNGRLGKDELAVIDMACKNIYYRYAEDPVPERMPILSDLFDEIQSLPNELGAIGRRLATSLTRYTQGTLSYFNHRSNVDINARVVCFDLKKMDGNQRDLAMLIIQDLIWGRVALNREKGKSTRVYIDEFHLLLRAPTTAAYSVEIYKRFRKWGGLPCGITQNIKDLFRSPEIQNILDTTNFIGMLNQSGDDARLLAEHLELSAEEENYIKSGEAGKGLIWVEGAKVPFEDDFPKDTLCYKVMTTRPEEMIRDSEARKLGLGN